MKRSRQERRESALELQEERDKRTPQEQIKRLDTKLGIGKGAKKERAKLEKLIKRLKK